MIASIFLDFNLPNPTTWFYFSLLLVVALFVRLDRFFTLRNWDLLTLMLLAPGFLLLQEGHLLEQHHRLSLPEALHEKTDTSSPGKSAILSGYIWLITGSGYFFIRCLFDLGLVRRPNFAPNLNLPGLSSLMIVLYIFMIVVAIQRLPDMPIEQIGKEPIAINRIQEGTTSIVHYQAGQTDLSRADTRFWVERTVALSLHLSVLIALVLIGAKHFHDWTSGIAAACLYLLLPYTAYHISQVHHIWPTAFILWAIYTYREPLLTGLLPGLAAGSFFFPLLLFPLWFGFYRGRGVWRFSFGFLFSLSVSLTINMILLLQEGGFAQDLSLSLNLSDWQSWKMPQTEGIWTGSHWAYRLPVSIAYMAFVILTMFWPSQRHFGQVIAQTTAVIIGIQFWYADQGGAYVLWYLPMLLLVVFRPNLVDRRPPLIEPANDWLIATLSSIRRKIPFHWPKSLLRIGAIRVSRWRKNNPG